MLAFVLFYQKINGIFFTVVFVFSIICTITALLCFLLLLVIGFMLFSGFFYIFTFSSNNGILRLKSLFYTFTSTKTSSDFCCRKALPFFCCSKLICNTKKYFIICENRIDFRRINCYNILLYYQPIQRSKAYDKRKNATARY